MTGMLQRKKRHDSLRVPGLRVECLGAAFGCTASAGRPERDL